MKDHEIRECISELLEIAIKYHGAQQLREKIRGVVLRIRDSFLANKNQPRTNGIDAEVVAIDEYEENT